MYQVEHTFAALGDATRLAIIQQLAERETSLSELANPFSMSQTAVTKHVGILAQAGLVEINKRGRTRYCRLKTKPMQQAEQWLETYQKFWKENLNNLANYLDQEE
ncbi:MAG: metalloregulator ArsR/SmtB family transcription factor [Acidiferrobacterales bacterium]|nr:metalloregulator ArsR/SmtB family transcription factor [Acidiferrobacterales bacterium]